MWPFKSKPLPVSFVKAEYIGIEMMGVHPSHAWVVTWRQGDKVWSTRYHKHAGLRLDPPNEDAMDRTFQSIALTMT